MWSGISAYNIREAARAQARLYPNLGGFVAMMRVQPGQGIRVEQTGPPHYFTLLSAAAALRAPVVEIEPV